MLTIECLPVLQVKNNILLVHFNHAVTLSIRAAINYAMVRVQISAA